MKHLYILAVDLVLKDIETNDTDKRIKLCNLMGLDLAEFERVLSERIEY